MAAFSLRLFCAYLVNVLVLVTAFNLDDKHPVIFRGPTSERRSYFGYSVELAENSSNSSWVLVGAPRVNSSSFQRHNLVETGALYGCDVNAGYCEEVVVDPKGNYRQAGIELIYRHHKQHGWLGGAIATAPYRNTSKIAVCGHLWGNQWRNDEIFLNGICYWFFSSDLPKRMMSQAPSEPTKQLLPLIKSDKQYDGADRSPNYAYGLYGMSARFSEDSEELLAGAPGVSHSTGAAVRYKSLTFDPSGRGESRRRRRSSDQDSIPLFTKSVGQSEEHLSEYEYFGYSVALGQFFSEGKRYYVAGAPRADLTFGKVFVFEYGPNTDSQLSVRLSRRGDQAAAYFGAAVAAGDISGDGRADLLVGAPQWATAAGMGREEGVVFVYLSGAKGGDGLDSSPQVLRGDGVSGSRFGTTIVIAGDLDRDGFDDIIVGAPFENENRGSVYIFSGVADRVSDRYSQKIAASDLSSELFGFGFSISHAAHVDDNHYPDLTVGSYMNDAAVLLRSRPVIRFSATLQSTPDRLQLVDRQLNIQACLKYYGHQLPRTVDVDFTVRVRSTAVIALFEESSADVVAFSAKLSDGEFKCRPLIVQFIGEVADFTKSVVLTMNYTLVTANESATVANPVFIDVKNNSDDSSAVADRLSQFCSDCPVVNLLSDSQRGVVTRVPFSMGCGEDDLCDTQMKVQLKIADLKGGYFVIGSSLTLNIGVVVMNEGEPASQPTVTITIPRPLDLARTPSLCSVKSTDKHTEMICKIQPHPLTKSEHGLLDLKLDVSRLKPGVGRVVLKFNASSDGHESRPGKNILMYHLQLKTEADIAVKGEALTSLIYYEKLDERDESERGTPNYEYLNHQYHVLRYLQSPAPPVNFSVLVPVNWTDGGTRVVQYLDVYRPIVLANEQQLNCSISTGVYLNKKGDGYEKSASPPAGSQYRDLTLSSADLETLDRSGPFPDLPDSFYTWLSCTEPGIQCAHILCPPVPFPSLLSSLVFTFKMRVKMHKIEPVVGKLNRLVITTTAMARIGQQLPYQLQPAGGGRPDVARLHTVLLPSSLQPLPVWIILVSVLGALLLLAVITYGLYRAGFFKRRRRPDDL